MINEYHRPETIEEALALLQRKSLTLPMGGGTLLNAPHKTNFAVADLQALPLSDMNAQGKFFEAGANVTLASLAKSPDIQDELKKVIHKEATQNLLNQATVAGALVCADGRSPFGCAMLALGAQLHLLPGDELEDYGQFLHRRVGLAEGLPHLPGHLITQVKIHTGATLSYEFAARSPADRPVVIIAAAAWPSGRLRIVVGGWGTSPRLVLDATDHEGILLAVESATAEAGDEWASAAYRKNAAGRLAIRAVDRLI